MDFYSVCYLVFELEKALPDPKTEIVPDQQSLSFAIETGFYSKNVSVLQVSNFAGLIWKLIFRKTKRKLYFRFFNPQL